MKFEPANGDQIRFVESGGRWRHINVGVEFSRWCTEHERNLDDLREQVAELSRPLELICNRFGLDASHPRVSITDELDRLRLRCAVQDQTIESRNLEIQDLGHDVTDSYKRGRRDATLTAVKIAREPYEQVQRHGPIEMVGPLRTLVDRLGATS